MTSGELWLRQNLHVGPAVFLQVPRELDERAFGDVMGVLRRHAGGNWTGSQEHHWTALRERMAGLSPWSTVLPAAPKAPETLAERSEWALRLPVVSRIAKVRPYTSFVVDGIEYVIDVFNPRNELGLQYAGAGEPVVALLLIEPVADPVKVQPQLIRDRIGEVESFYSILADLATLLKPSKVCGGAYLVRVMLAYYSGVLAAETSPWDLMWTLTSATPSEIAGVPRERLSAAFSRVVDVPEAALTLLQVVPGFDSVMSREYVPAARALDRRSVTEVGE